MAGRARSTAKRSRSAIRTQLRKDFAGASLGAAKCPDDVEKKTGKQVTCTATVGNEPVPITVTVTDRDPGFRILRDVAVLDVAKVQEFVQTQYDQQVGVLVTAACAPGKTVLVAKPQTTIPCTVTDSQGTTDTVQVLVERHQRQHQDRHDSSRCVSHRRIATFRYASCALTG